MRSITKLGFIFYKLEIGSRASVHGFQSSRRNMIALHVFIKNDRYGSKYTHHTRYEAKQGIILACFPVAYSAFCSE